MKRILALCCALVLALSMLGCATAEEAAAPKYVFMFIGDGMGSPQVSATQYFLGTLQNPDATLPTPAELKRDAAQGRIFTSPCTPWAFTISPACKREGAISDSSCGLD